MKDKQTEQPHTFLTKDRTHLSDEGQRVDQAATHRQTKQPPTFLTKNRERTKQPATHTQTDRPTKQPATHRPTKQKPTFLTNLGGLRACDAEDAQLGQNEAVGVDEDMGVDGGEQQAGHERQQQGVSQVLQVHVEDGQHQAQRLVQLLRLAPLQHFLLGWWREGEKK